MKTFEATPAGTTAGLDQYPWDDTCQHCGGRITWAEYGKYWFHFPSGQLTCSAALADFYASRLEVSK